MNTISENQRGSVFLCCLGALRSQTSPTEGVLQQTTPMAYATRTKTSRRKSMSPKQFGLSQTRPAEPPLEKALQNLGAKIENRNEIMAIMPTASVGMAPVPNTFRNTYYDRAAIPSPRAPRPSPCGFAGAGP